MEILLSLTYLFFLGGLIKYLPFFRNIPYLSTSKLWFFFVLKVVSGIVLILIYTYYYDVSIADFNKYYKDGLIMYSALFDHPLSFFRMLTGIQSGHESLQVYYDQMGSWYRPWESPVYNDNRVVVRFNALANIFSFGYLHVNSILMNFLSFTGLVALYKFVMVYFPAPKMRWLPWGFFLFPSLLFWGSGLLKEGLLIWGMGLFIFNVDVLLRNKTLAISGMIGLLLSIIIIVLVKPYTIIFWLPCHIAFYISLKKSLWKQTAVYLLVFTVFILLALIFGKVFPGYNLIEVVSRKQNDFINFTSLTDAGSLMHTRYLEPSLFDWMIFFPQALFYSLFRPHIFESYSWVVFAAALENLFIMALVLLALVKGKRNHISHPLFVLSIFFIISLMGFVGLVTPIHGGLVRYKIMVLPFLWTSCLLIIPFESLRFFKYKT